MHRCSSFSERFTFSFVHASITSYNDIRERIPSRLPLAKDGSIIRWHRLDIELHKLSSSMDLIFCLVIKLAVDNLAQYCPIKCPSAMVRNEANSP